MRALSLASHTSSPPGFSGIAATPRTLPTRRSCGPGKSFDRLRDRAAFRPWLTRIVVNVCRNDLRHRRVLQIDPLGDDDRTPADPIDDGSLKDGVARALDRLGPDQRVVVVLRYWKDLQVDDIARLLGVPSGTVKWRLHTANRQIKAELSRSGWEVER